MTNYTLPTRDGHELKYFLTVHNQLFFAMKKKGVIKDLATIILDKSEVQTLIKMLKEMELKM